VNQAGVYDLHVHSLYSDGLYSPLQIANLATRSGLAGVVLTDHDHIPQVGDVDSLGNVEIGVELSTQLADRGLHILGYGFDPRHPDLRAVCARLQEGRRYRWESMTAAIRKQGLSLDENRMAQAGACPSPGRMHLAREIVRKGHAPTVRSAFERYLRRFDAGFDTRSSGPLETEEAIRVLHEAGGVAILAHPPADLNVEKWRRLAAAELDGVEVDYPGVASNHQRFLKARIAEYGWVGTAGSDFHGDNPQRYLGCRNIAASVYHELCRKRRIRTEA